MRSLDWVDRLAGVDHLEAYTEEWGTFRPIGPWLTWPKWRRLVDLARARVWEPFHAGYKVVQYSAHEWKDRRKFGTSDDEWYWPWPREVYTVDVAAHDIHLMYEWDLPVSDPLLEGVEAD